MFWATATLVSPLDPPLLEGAVSLAAGAVAASTARAMP